MSWVSSCPRIERQRRAIIGDRLRRVAQVEAGDAQRVADVGALRRQGRRLLEPVDRFRQPRQPVERNPGEVGGVGIVRRPFRLPREPAGGLGVVAILVREPAELATDAGIGGAQRAESLPCLPRGRPVAAFGFGQREIEQRRREIGVARKRRAKCGDRRLQRMLPAKHFAAPGTRLGGGRVGGFGALQEGRRLVEPVLLEPDEPELREHPRIAPARRPAAPRKRGGVIERSGGVQSQRAREVGRGAAGAAAGTSDMSWGATGTRDSRGREIGVGLVYRA